MHLPSHAGPSRHRVVIIGAGFGGIFAAKALRRHDVDVTIIDRTTHHLFQPLLYQVATGILSEGVVAPSIREILKRQKNAKVLLGTVTGIDVESRTVTSSILDQETVTPYDSLIVAAGAGQSYFGNDHFAEHAPGMKSIDDALELRGRIFGAFELAELETDPVKREEWMTFVVVGAGPTGVEMAGQIAELAHRTLRGNFRNIRPEDARIVLVDGSPQVLSSFGDHLSSRALRSLNNSRVEVRLGAMVKDVDSTGIAFDEAGVSQRIAARTKIWAAGVSASPLGRVLADAAGAEIDRAGRVKVLPDCTVPGRPEIFVIGDMMALENLPGVSPVAIQTGRYAARQIVRDVDDRERQGPFRYRDKGSMATVSRFRAVASIGRLRLSGFLAWLLWMAVHLVYLTAFKSKVTALLHWSVSFVGRGRSERTVTLQQVVARNAIQRAQELDPDLFNLDGVPEPAKERVPATLP